MTQIVYTNPDGFCYLVEVPDGIIDERLYQYGIRIGPPDLSELNLVNDLECKLNNILCERQIYEYRSMNGRRGEVLQIIQETLHLNDVVKAKALLLNIIGIYQRASFD
jgi:hypothetical protein